MFSLFSFRADKSQFAPENISKYSNTLRITLLKKNGRRTPLNFNETIYAMKQAFPSVKVTVIDVTVDPFEHQIEILRSTTVLITPSGGISCAAPLLPRGSTVLQYGFYNEHTDAAYDYDSFQFTEFSHFSTVIFPVLRKDLQESTCQDNSFDKRQFHDWGKYVYCSFNVDVHLLAVMVHEILNTYSLHQESRRFGEQL